MWLILTWYLVGEPDHSGRAIAPRPSPSGPARLVWGY